MTTDKNEMYRTIQAMRKSHWPVDMAYQMLEKGELEDKDHLLMAIVIEQEKIISAMQKSQDRLISNYYKGVKSCESYAEIQPLKSSEINQQ